MPDRSLSRRELFTSFRPGAQQSLGSKEAPKDPITSRRDAMKILLGIAMGAVSALKSSPGSTEEKKESKNFVTSFDQLNKKGPEDIYILLFETDRENENFDFSDDLISDTAELMGSDNPQYYHVEIAYRHPETKEWMVMGCRPPECSIDKPITELYDLFKAHDVDIRHVKIPTKNQLKARKYFTSVFEGEKYQLAGPNKTNCTDAVKETGKAIKFPGIGNIQEITKDEIKNAPGIKKLLEEKGISSVDAIMERDSLIFPGEFAKLGTYSASIEKGTCTDFYQ